VLPPAWYLPVAVQVGSRTQQVSIRRLGFSMDYTRMLSEAFRAAGRNQPVNVLPRTQIDRNRLRNAINRLGRPLYKAPQSARVVLGVTRIKRIGGHNGRGIDMSFMWRQIVRALRHPTTPRTIVARTKILKPPVGMKALERIYGTYISVDRSHFKLRLFKRLRLVKTYPIAVGMAGLETPPGLRHVLDKQVNPAWHVPNSPWAGSLAGQTIPAGSPADPLKARWLGLGDGVGIHGTAEDWSIGTRASHGCIRMHVSDVIDLYNRVPVGTPVLIH
jgi:hypothetical protein